MEITHLTFLGFNISTVLILIMVLVINSNLEKLNKCNEKWDILETIIAMLFGWIGVFYILIQYGEYLFKYKKNKK